MPLKDFDEAFAEQLRDADYAAEYLRTALQESPDALLLAVHEVARANGGVAQLARRASMRRENTYRLLRPRSNPRLRAMQDVLGALGMELTVARRTP